MTTWFVPNTLYPCISHCIPVYPSGPCVSQLSWVGWTILLHSVHLGDNIENFPYIPLYAVSQIGLPVAWSGYVASPRLMLFCKPYFWMSFFNDVGCSVVNSGSWSVPSLQRNLQIWGARPPTLCVCLHNYIHHSGLISQFLLWERYSEISPK